MGWELKHSIGSFKLEAELLNHLVSRFKAGWQETEWQMLSVNLHPPTRGREKEEKGERLEIEYKKFY